MTSDSTLSLGTTTEILQPGMIAGCCIAVTLGG